MNVYMSGRLVGRKVGRDQICRSCLPMSMSESQPLVKVGTAMTGTFVCLHMTTVPR